MANQTQTPRSCDRLPDRRVAEIHADERGATMLEYALLMAAIGLPAYFLLMQGLKLLIGYFQMNTTINGLPFP